jgi:hypothetical protein
MKTLPRHLSHLERQLPVDFRASVKNCEIGRKAAVLELRGLLQCWIDKAAPSALGFDAPPSLRRQSPELVACCKGIGLQLRGLVIAHSDGTLSEMEFVEAVLRMESVVARGGFTLTASNTLDDWTVFKLWVSGALDSCGSFEFLPETGRFRPAGSTPTF